MKRWIAGTSAIFLVTSIARAAPFVESATIAEYGIYNLSSKIVKDLAPHAERIVTEVRKRDLAAVLQVVLWISTDEQVSTPAIGFDADVISFLHRVGGTIDIDTYRNTPEGQRTSA